MTKRTSAANAAALPDNNSLDRRTMLASAGAAAVLAAISTPTAALSIDDADAPLLALRSRWLEARAAIDAETLKRSPADQATADAIMARAPHPSEATDDDGLERILTLRQEMLDQAPPYPEETPEERERREARLCAACKAEDAVIEAIATLPARTLAGIGFKVHVYNVVTDGIDYPKLAASIMADVAAFAAAHPTLRI